MLSRNEGYQAESIHYMPIVLDINNGRFDFILLRTLDDTHKAAHTIGLAFPTIPIVGSDLATLFPLRTAVSKPEQISKF